MARTVDEDRVDEFAFHFVRLGGTNKKQAAEAAGVPYETVCYWFRTGNEVLHELLDKHARSQSSEIVLAMVRKAREGDARAGEFLLSAWKEEFDARARAAKIAAEAHIAGAIVESGKMSKEEVLQILMDDPMTAELIESNDSNDLGGLGETSDKKAYRSTSVDDPQEDE